MELKYSLISVLQLLTLSFCFCEELLELSCHLPTHCKQFQLDGVNVTCLNGSCVCSSVAQGERIKCKPKETQRSNIIGGACPCTQQGAECNTEEDTCYCALNYVASADRRRCLQKTVALYAECETDEQCVAGTVYAACNKTTHRCGCGTGFAAHAASCRAIVGMTAASCVNNTQCQVFDRSASCASGLCLCFDGYVSDAEHKSCIEVSNFARPCTEHTQCLQHLGPGAVCHNKVCKCADSHISTQEVLPNGTEVIVCKKIAVLGIYCRDEQDCYQRNLPESEQSMSCFYGECNCKHGFNSINSGKCMRGSYGSYGSRLSIFTLFNTLALAWSALCLGVIFRNRDLHCQSADANN